MGLKKSWKALFFCLISIQDIIPRGSMKSFSESFLIYGMSDKSNSSWEKEESVKYSSLYVHLFFLIIHSNIFENIEKHSSNVSVYIEYEICLFFESESLYWFSKFEMCTNWKVLRKSIKYFTSLIRIKSRFHFVSDSRDVFSLLFHCWNKIFSRGIILYCF